MGNATGTYGGKGGVNPDVYTNKANFILDDALAKALPYYNHYAKQAMGSVTDQGNKALQVMWRDNLQREANLNESKQQSLSYQSPFLERGYGALDTLAGLSGLPKGNSARSVDSRLQQAAMQRRLAGADTQENPSIGLNFQDMPLDRTMIQGDKYALPIGTKNGKAQ